jgi:hypothetical protein
MLYASISFVVLGLALAAGACLFFRKPGVSFTEVAVRVLWFADPIVRLRRPGVILQWLGLGCLIGAGLILLLRQ